MPAPNAAACNRQKTAIAFETGNIQGMSERFIAESDNYAMKKIPQGSYDTEIGASPRFIRYSTAPIPDTAYIDPSVTGDESDTMNSRDCAGDEDPISTTVNKRGAAGCNIPGQSIEGGYDEFGRTLNAKAWETRPQCAFDLLNKGSDHVNAYISMLRNDLPMRAREQFEFALERLVIENGFYNTSAVGGYITSQGHFPAIPAGTLDIGMLKRLIPVLKTEGWTGSFEIQVSEQAFEEMRFQYKSNYGIDLEGKINDSLTHFVGDKKVINFAGINFVITDTPPRGYLRPLPDSTGYEFVRVLPTRPRAGTGAGVVTEPNPDYHQCRTICNGISYELYEVGLYIHESACQRQAFALPAMAGKTWGNNTFNFEVNMVDGPYIDCNVDNFKFFFRILHAFGFTSRWPERMGALIYRVSPTRINVNTPICDSETTPTEVEVSMAPANPVELDSCAVEDRTDCDQDAILGHMIPEPTASDPNPAGTTGVIEWRNGGPIDIPAVANETFTICVERVTGVNGAASVDVDSTDGTATSASGDFVVVNETLNWAAEEGSVKCVTVTLGATPTVGQSFTLDLSAVSGATLSAQTALTINLVA